jgi:hypothetical protein
MVVSALPSAETKWFSGSVHVAGLFEDGQGAGVSWQT